MPYATGRVYYDADSHVMETSDWLEQHAEPGIRERLRPLALGGVTRGRLELRRAVRDGGVSERSERANGHRLSAAGGTHWCSVIASKADRTLHAWMVHQ